MLRDWVFSRARPADLGDVVSLLGASNLPTVDVGRHLETFILARLRGTLVGVVGVELYDDVGLLRSLCVVESDRGQGAGRALVSAMEALVAERGMVQLYLLTTTAAPFFARSGFAAIPRDQAPPAICRTEQFRSLCPASATLMCKSVRLV